MKRLAFALLALPLFGPAASATPTTFEITETFAFDWHTVLDDPQILDEDARKNVIDLRNRLNLRLRTGDWRFGLRLDAAYFPSPPISRYSSDFRPEEMFVTWSNRTWTITAGDDYLTLGRGLALSLRKFDEVGFATALRGAHTQLKLPKLKARLGAGFTNVVNVDSVEEKLVPDPSDLIFLARIETDIIPKLEIGAHIVDIERRHSDLRNTFTGPLFGDDDDARIQGRRFERTLIAGLSLESLRLADVLDVYAELGWLDNDETRSTLEGDTPAGQDGLSLYASTTATLGRWTALLEGKHYERWKIASTLHPDTADAQGMTQTFPYITPPSLERIDQRVVNNTDVSGLHLRLDHAFDKTQSGDKHILFLSQALFVDAPAEHEYTYHGYFGWERTTEDGERMLFQLGHRREEAPDALADETTENTSGLTRLSMFHLDLDWFLTLTPGLDLQTHWTHEYRHINVGADAIEDRYFEGTFYTSFSLGAWSLTTQLEYLTRSTEDDGIFPGIFLQWKPDPASVVRLFGGRSKGGLKCSGGVCRIFPDFEGVKLETTLRF
jgi:hypothetical protein